MSHPSSRRRFLQTTASLACTLAAGRAFGTQSETPLHGVVYGFQPSVVFATYASVVLGQLRTRYEPDLGERLVVMPGNSSGEAIKAAHAAPSDGGTVLLSPSSVMTLLPHLRTLPGVDAVADFVPIAPIGEFTLAFIVGSAVPAHVTTMTGYLDWVRANPMRATYGIPGTGTGTHLAGAELSRLSGVTLRPAPYKSVAAQTSDVASGAQPAAVTSLHNVRHDFQGVRVLAITSGQRWFSHPDVPTLMELGLAEMPIVESYGFYMPAGVATAKQDELGEAITRVMQVPRVQSALADAWMRPATTTRDTYAATLARERAALLPMVQRYGFTQGS